MSMCRSESSRSASLPPSLCVVRSHHARSLRLVPHLPPRSPLLASPICSPITGRRGAPARRTPELRPRIRPRSDPGATRHCAARVFGASVAARHSRPRPITRGRRAPRSPPLQPQQQPQWRRPLGMLFWKAMLQTRCIVLGLRPLAIGRTTRAMTMLSGTTKSAPFWGQLFWVASYYCTTAADQLGARQGHCA